MADQSARREGSIGRDTIAAQATAPGQAAIAVVRISGAKARPLAEALAGRMLSPRRAELCRFSTPSGEPIDEGIAIFYPAPRSFTGEDVVELQCHGSPVVVDWLLDTLYSAGARPAEPGEFSLRAFLNDKLDLPQAEAIADLIASDSRAQALAATRSLTGRFSEAVAHLQTELTQLRVLCESWLDFPDEDIDHAASEELGRRHAALSASLALVLAHASLGRQLSDGLSVAIAGRPNAGKSSLMNRLARIEAAIVTELPGTTRDTIRASVSLGGIALTLVDMAGLRATEDIVEGEGIRRAEAEIAASDHVLWVADIEQGLESATGDAHRTLPAGKPLTIVLNKIDRIAGEPRIFGDDVAVIALSAKTGNGVDLLETHLRQLAGADTAQAGGFSARRRHVEALERARGHVAAAGSLLDDALEIAAEELRAAQAELDTLTGEHSSDDLLGEIFSSFCIGK